VRLSGDAESGTGGGTLDMSEESKVALAISAGGNFGRAPDNRRPRGYDLRGPQRLPLQGRAPHQRRREFRPLITVDRGDTSEVSGGGVLGDLQRPWRCPVGVFEVSGSVFWRRVHLLRASPRRLSYRRAGPLVPQSSPAPRLPNRPCHSVPLVPLDPMQAEPVHSLPSWVGIESGTIAP
jgi:hypothetical protein